MIRTLTRSLTLAAVVAFAGSAAAASNDAVVRPLKTVVNSIKVGRDGLALKQFAGEEQGKALTTDDWEKATPEQRKEFVELFHKLFAQIAFPKIRENFKNLGAVNYDEPEIDGSKASVASTIVIDHPLKKQELKLKYALVKDGSAWRVVDVAVLGDSMLAGIRDDQVKPLLKEGGWNKLLETMRAKAKELDGAKK
ncbi:MAG: ABC transporter substrate-binding protein [Myxococcaceae bacterium]|nr:ABC transporter substrate-binding protein [Myxococcaceae bacterium]